MRWGRKEGGLKEVQIRIRVIGGKELYGALLKTVARGSPKLPQLDSLPLEGSRINELLLCGAVEIG